MLLEENGFDFITRPLSRRALDDRCEDKRLPIKRIVQQPREVDPYVAIAKERDGRVAKPETATAVAKRPMECLALAEGC